MGDLLQTADVGGLHGGNTGAVKLLGVTGEDGHKYTVTVWV